MRSGVLYIPYALCMILVLGCAETEEGKGYLLRHAPITMPQAVQLVERNGHGRAVKAELRHSGTHVYYDIDVIDTMNKPRRVYVDAETGSVIRQG